MPNFLIMDEETILMKQIDECYAVLADPMDMSKGSRRRAEENGRDFCTYAPEEIIVAAGAHPIRLFGTGEKIHRAEAHLQSYCCSLVRGSWRTPSGIASLSWTAPSFPIPATRSSGSRTSGVSMWYRAST